MLSLLKNNTYGRCLNAVSAGTTDQTTPGVDTASAQTVLFGILFGAIVSTATISIKLQGSDDNSTWSDLEATAFAVYDSEDNKLCLLECVKPAYRYIRAYIDLGTANTTIDGVFYELAYGQRTQPVSQPSTVTHYGNKSFVSPPAGTA